MGFQKIIRDWVADQNIKPKKSTVHINGKYYKKEKLHTLIDNMSAKELAESKFIELADLEPKKLNKLLLTAIDEMYDKKVEQISGEEGQDDFWDKYAVAELCNPEEYPNVDGYVVYVKDTFQITDMSYRVLKRRIDPEIWAHMVPSIPAIRTKYDPTGEWVKRREVVDKGGNDILHVNLYRAPAYLRFTVTNPKMPPLIKEFLEFLFPDTVSREFVLGWIFNAMFNRAKTYLLVVGGEGAGKTLTAKLIIRLIGEHNSVKAKEDFIKNNFNSIMENKRFVFLDEFHATTTKETDVLKSRIEDNVTVEGKFKDQKVVENHASFMLINNYFTSVRIDPSAGRKFSVPEITDKSLVVEKGQKFVDRLLKSMASDNHIAHLAAYIRENYDGYIAPHEYLHTPRYEKVTVESASEGMRQLINGLLVDGYEEPIVIKDERAQHKRLGRGERFPTNMEVEKFFERFKWNNQLVGEVIYDEEEGAILKRRDDYQPPKI